MHYVNNEVILVAVPQNRHTDITGHGERPPEGDDLRG
jgi:hypothetical protein